MILIVNITALIHGPRCTGKHTSQAWESAGTSNPCRERQNFPSPGQLAFGTFTWRVLVAGGGGLEAAEPAE